MAEGKVSVTARFRAKTDCVQKLKESILSLVTPARGDAGCINYDLHQSSEEPEVFLLYENWVSKKLLDEHLAMPYLQAFLGTLDAVLAEPVDIKLWKMISPEAKP
jgi:quinol monooxygenase YgiN